MHPREQHVVAAEEAGDAGHQLGRGIDDEMAAADALLALGQVGVEQVENFIDLCLSLENLIDRFSPYTPKKTPEPPCEPTNVVAA